MNILINRDVLIWNILDILPVPDLINFIKTNSQISEELLTYFNDKIENYQYDLEINKIAIITFLKNFDNMANVHSFKNSAVQLISLNKELSDLMHIDHLPKYNNRVLYTHYALYMWWQIYFFDKIGYLVDNRDKIMISKKLARYINYPSQQLLFGQLVNIFRDFFTNNIYIDMPQTILYQIQYEKFDLIQILDIIKYRYYR